MRTQTVTTTTTRCRTCHEQTNSKTISGDCPDCVAWEYWSIRWWMNACLQLMRTGRGPIKARHLGRPHKQSAWLRGMGP